MSTVCIKNIHVLSKSVLEIKTACTGYTNPISLKRLIFLAKLAYPYTSHFLNCKTRTLFACLSLAFLLCSSVNPVHSFCVFTRQPLHTCCRSSQRRSTVFSCRAYRFSSVYFCQTTFIIDVVCFFYFRTIHF